MSSIGFWLRDSGNYISAKTGLTGEQVKFLRSFKVGDRIILWNNNREDSPDITLKQYTIAQPAALAENISAPTPQELDYKKSVPGEESNVDTSPHQEII